MDDGLPHDPSSSPSDTSTDGLTCLHCGYDLRGLSADGNCPECGRTIASGLQSHLRNNDPIWLARLELGAKFGGAALALSTLLTLISAVFEFFPRAHRFTYAIFYFPPLLELLGFWFLTTLSPTTPQFQRRPALRRAIRIAAILSFIMKVGSTGMGVRLQVAQTLIASAAFVALLFYLRHLAHFAGNRPVEQQLPALVVGWVVLNLATFTFYGSPPVRSNDVRVRVYYLLWIFAQIYASGLFFSLSRSLARAALYARNHWHRFSAAPANSPTF